MQRYKNWHTKNGGSGVHGQEFYLKITKEHR